MSKNDKINFISALESVDEVLFQEFLFDNKPFSSYGSEIQSILNNRWCIKQKSGALKILVKIEEGGCIDN